MNPFNPLTWLRWLGEFVQGWFLAIPWRDAPKAIPAVILTIVLFTTGFIAFSDGAGWRNRLLQRQLVVSWERDDFSTAEIILRRQLEADPDNSDFVHRFALVREAQSFSDEAEVLMRKLLRRRHLPSAKWLLQNRMLGQKWTDFDDQQLEDAGAAMKLISDAEPENLAVKKMYAEYLIFEQRLASAIPVLSDLATAEPMMGLQAAALARRLGKTEEARLYAAKTLERVEEMLKDDPTNGYLAMNIARNQIFLDRHSDAIRTLRNSLKLVQTDDERQLLSQAIGDAIVAYVNYIEQSPTDTVTERLRVLRMLEVAVQIAPNNPRVVTMVADHVLGNMNAEDRELAAVREALIKGSPAGIAHFIKGTAALMNEDHELAELHLEKAAEQLPRSAAILNNLAVALAMRPDPDYERALKVSNQAISQVRAPTPHFYETRGQILYRLERFREAISDLERTLAEPSLAAGAHELLATCYEQVGDTDLAEGHRLEAAEWKAKQEKESGEAAALPRRKPAGEVKETTPRVSESEPEGDDAAAAAPKPSKLPIPSEPLNVPD